jgi:hypothetical protein
MGLTTVTDPGTEEVIEVDFRRWLSITWAETVVHPEPKERAMHRVAGTGVTGQSSPRSLTATSPAWQPSVRRIRTTPYRQIAETMLPSSPEGMPDNRTVVTTAHTITARGQWHARRNPSQLGL